MTESHPTSLRVSDLLDELQSLCAAEKGVAAAMAWRQTVSYICIVDGRVECVEGDDNQWMIGWLNKRLMPQGQLTTGFTYTPRPDNHAAQDANFLAAFVAYMEKHPEPISTSKVVNEIKRPTNPPMPYGFYPGIRAAPSCSPRSFIP